LPHSVYSFTSDFAAEKNKNDLLPLFLSQHFISISVDLNNKVNQQERKMTIFRLH